MYPIMRRVVHRERVEAGVTWRHDRDRPMGDRPEDPLRDSRVENGRNALHDASSSMTSRLPFLSSSLPPFLPAVDYYLAAPSCSRNHVVTSATSPSPSARCSFASPFPAKLLAARPARTVVRPSQPTTSLSTRDFVAPKLPALPSQSSTTGPSLSYSSVSPCDLFLPLLFRPGMPVFAADPCFLQIAADITLSWRLSNSPQLNVLRSHVPGQPG